MKTGPSPLYHIGHPAPYKSPPKEPFRQSGCHLSSGQSVCIGYWLSTVVSFYCTFPCSVTNDKEIKKGKNTWVHGLSKLVREMKAIWRQVLCLLDTGNLCDHRNSLRVYLVFMIELFYIFTVYWRCVKRNQEMRLDPVGAKKTMNFTNWLRCCLFRRPLRLNWTRRPSLD